ncbi:TlpA family protein disulfide reductase [Sphingobacterium siyangense]|uniref:TlpA family protein disulfide reductase n=1 Tax=Sphingobacterium siyangense TaxID=459529 RepID=UPI0028B0FCEA|nr:TlpA disulfide reductase family protein [Sphingobacterium siyangense]
MNNFYKAGRELSIVKGHPSSKQNTSKSFITLFDKVVNIPVIQIALLVILFVLVSMFSLSAQTPRKESGADGLFIKPLKVGDSIPEELWNLSLNVTNHPAARTNISLQDYPGKKLIILDFWATWCGPCIKGLNQLDSIKAALSNESIEFIPVSNEDEKKVLKKMADNQWKFFSVYGDNKLSRYFPHQVLPHLVWIRDGKVMAITGHEYYDITYFKKALAEPLNLTEKVVPLIFDANKSAYENLVEFSTDKYLQRSILTKYIQGLSDNVVQQTDNTHLYTNMSLATLLVQANQPEIPMSGHLGRLIFNCADSVKDRLLMPAKSLNKMERAIWLRENGYCYAIEKRSNTRIESIKSQMIDDINGLLMDKWNVKAMVKRTKVPGWALKRIAKVDKLKYLGNDKPKIWDDNTLIYYRNVEIADLISNLNYINPDLGIPIVDDTQIDFPIDLQMTVDRDLAHNLNALNSDLASYGLKLVRSQATLNMLVFENLKR